MAILDADKEGFLRGETSLIQTIGRAARNVEGTVLMYADKETKAMRAAIERPTAAARSSSPTTRSTGSPRRRSSRGSRTSPSSCRPSRRSRAGANAAPPSAARRGAAAARAREDDRRARGGDAAAAEDLRFEYAAQLRDELRELRRDLQEIQAAEAPRGGEAAIRDFRRGHGLGCRAVPLDRQAIERRDFPIGRRGYDPAPWTPTCGRWRRSSKSCSAQARAGGADLSMASTAGTQVQSDHRGRGVGGGGDRARRAGERAPDARGGRPRTPSARARRRSRRRARTSRRSRR